MTRLLIPIHRYVGIAVGWLIMLWCVSGIVMIYVPYPAATIDEHVEALPELDFGNCCMLGTDAIGPATRVESFSIEMGAAGPVLSIPQGFATIRIALSSGHVIDHVSAAEAVAIARARTRHWPGRGEPAYVAETVRDQWTVGLYRPGRVLHRVALNDPAGTEWYLSSATGEIVQATTARERFWNWPGAVMHWLYLTPLRQTGQTWANIVIWSTLVAMFLTVLGIWIGISRLRAGGRASRLSPYRGMALWHHMLGLGLGLVTLTWLFSGLMSMNPWGLLLTDSPRVEAARLADWSIPASELASLLGQLDAQPLPAGTTYLAAAPWQGQLYLSAHDRSNRMVRLDAATLTPAPLDEAELQRAAATLRPDADVATAQLINRPDAYYYDHKGANEWPVFRVIYDDAAATRYYIDPRTGALLGRIDSNQAAYRWLFTALHSLDFAALLRTRPIWDAVMLVLLAGVAVVSGTGTWLGCRYLARKLRRV